MEKEIVFKLLKKSLSLKLEKLRDNEGVLKGQLQALQDKDVGDEVDMAEREIEQEKLVILIDRNNKLIYPVLDALTKIEQHIYDGCCSECGEEIDLKRLEIVPEANLCVECVKAMRK